MIYGLLGELQLVQRAELRFEAAQGTNASKVMMTPERGRMS